MVHAKDVEIQKFGLLKVNKYSTSPNSSCLRWHLSIVLVLLKFLCQISVDVNSLVTSFNILELRSKLLGFNILGMNHGPTVLQFLTNLRYLEVVAPLAWLLSAFGS